MSETVIEAFERLAREYLKTPDISVQHVREPTVPIGGTGSFEIQEQTTISVTHHGDPEALEDLEDAHGDAIMSRWNTTSRDLAPAGSEERVLVTDAEFVLGCDPHEEYVSGGAVSGVSGSGSSGSASPETETDAEETASTDETTPARPDPSREMSEEAGGIRHVLAADEPGAEDQHLCGTPLGEAEYEGSIPDLYESLLDAIADPMLCDECETAMADYYGIPKDDVHDHREDVYG